MLAAARQYTSTLPRVERLDLGGGFSRAYCELASKAMRVTSLDHLVLTVRDVEATCAFYERVLGMSVVAFGNGRKAVSFGSQKINLHQLGNEIEPKAARPTSGSADLCFLIDVRLAEFAEHLQAQQVSIVEGPVQRAGAKGSIRSIYFRDPDANLIEVSVYESSAD